jgi:hypothetical protein
MWEPRRLTTLWASTACYRDSFYPHPDATTANDQMMQLFGVASSLLNDAVGSSRYVVSIDWTISE